MRRIRADRSHKGSSSRHCLAVSASAEPDTKLALILPRVADGEPGIPPSTLAMLVAVLKCFDLFIGMLVRSQDHARQITAP